MQTAAPGCRAPHVWLGRAQARLSTLDLLGPGFTLLAAPQGEAWREQALAAGAALGVQVDAYRIGAAGLADLGGFAEAYGIGAAGAVLVRPDGHVAWRAQGAPGDDQALAAVLTQILAR